MNRPFGFSLDFACFQNPDSNVATVRDSLAAIYRKGGVGGLWHGTSAGVMKTVPKYCVAVTVKVGKRVVRGSARIYTSRRSCMPSLAFLFVFAVIGRKRAATLLHWRHPPPTPAPQSDTAAAAVLGVQCSHERGKSHVSFS